MDRKEDRKVVKSNCGFVIQVYVILWKIMFFMQDKFYLNLNNTDFPNI